jgi:Tfp pilus assembly protein PilX
MRHLRDEQGFVLATAIILLMVIMGLGLGLLMFTDNQQRASTRSQSSEAAFDLAEAALEAQIGQLSREWPSSASESAKHVPGSKATNYACTPSSSTTLSYCPEPASLEKAYPNTGTTSCSGSEPWGSSNNNKWTTYVREDPEGGTYFNSATEETKNPYAPVKESGAANPSAEKVWVRAVGVVNCKVATVVALVSAQFVHANFPESAIDSNWFVTTNNGNGNNVIVNARGNAEKVAQAGPIYYRCASPHPHTKCAEYQSEQISGSVPKEEPNAPSTTLTSTQMEELRAQAKSEGRFFSESNCPTKLSQLTGMPTYIENCGNLSFSSNEEANSASKPGFLILANGTLSLRGTTNFYGIIYAADKQGAEEAIVSLQGNTKVVGGIEVDGLGGLEFGSSHQENLIYEPKAASELETYTGAAATRNSFRQVTATE